MKPTVKPFQRKSNHSLVIQPIIALLLVLSPSLILGYEAPPGQAGPIRDGGRSGSLHSIEMGEVLPLSF